MSDIRYKTSTQIPGLLPKHGYQSQDLTKMCDLWPVHRCQSYYFTQFSESSPVHRYQSQHQSSTQMSETSPVQKEFYREKQLAFLLHLAFLNIYYTYVHYRKCSLSWEFNLIKCALNWELALPGKSGYEISPFVFSIRHILKNPEVLCL